MKTRAGRYRTNLTGEMAYKSFIPSVLPPQPPVAPDAEGIAALVTANKWIGVLDALSTKIPNVNLFISMYVRKEALLSSQIEGTQATLDDLLDPDIESNINSDVADVVNYIKAVEFGLDRLRTLPLCNRLIRETHAVLLQDGRGEEKSPGEFRTSQNWIGPSGCTLKQARYIPPVPEDMVNAMSDLEKFINADDEMDSMIKAALIHYQFETIHPFLDGNGRIGRLLIMLFLIEKGLLHSPALYISYFLKKNRIEYYDRMTEVRRTGNYEQWVKFFLEAVSESARDAVDTIDQLIALHDKNLALVSAEGRGAGTAIKLFQHLEACPIIEIKKTAVNLGMSYNAVANAVKRLIGKQILVKKEKSGRSRTFAYEDYLKILRKDTQ
jgi:Fic family protein